MINKQKRKKIKANSSSSLYIQYVATCMCCCVHVYAVCNSTVLLGLLLYVLLNNWISISKSTEFMDAGVWGIRLFTMGKKLCDLRKPNTLIFCYFTLKLGTTDILRQTHLSSFPSHYWVRGRKAEKRASAVRERELHKVQIQHPILSTAGIEPVPSTPNIPVFSQNISADIYIVTRDR